METILETARNGIAALMDPARLAPLIQATILLIAGFVLARMARFAAERAFRHLASQQVMLIKRGAYYLVLTLFVISAMRELGFEFGVLLGAAGIVTVAIGFASQTSASNLISGLFLVLERAIEVGNVIKVGNVTGEILSIDLLSTKLRTFDNLMVRIPNETMVKSEIVNLNRFPIRRADLQIGVAYKEDLGRVRDVLMEVATKNPTCLEEPAPLLIAQGYGESSVNYQFSVWAKTENFLALRNSMQMEIKKAFDEAGIEIPFPHRTLYTGSTTDPLPIRLVTESPGADEPPAEGPPPTEPPDADEPPDAVPPPERREARQARDGGARP